MLGHMQNSAGAKNATDHCPDTIFSHPIVVLQWIHEDFMCKVQATTPRIFNQLGTQNVTLGFYTLVSLT